MIITNLMNYLILTMKMTFTQVDEMLTATDKSPSYDYTNPDDQPPTKVNRQLVSKMLLYCVQVIVLKCF